VKYLLISLSLWLCSYSASALEQDEFNLLIDNIKQKNFDVVEAYLAEERATATTDPDYTVLLLNYSFNKARTTHLTTGLGVAKKGDYELTSLDGQNTKGFLREVVSFDEVSILEAVLISQDNLRSFPNQLDIHFGIIAITQNIGELSVMADQLISMLKTSKEIDNKWQWGKVGSMEGDPEEFMIQGLLPRTAVLFRLESEEGDRLLINVSEALIQYYPNKVYGYANLGSLYGATKRYDEARKYYEKALEVDPGDEVVRANLKHLGLVGE
jgi:tetratricopeptide (TPR) repeat protein